MEWLCVLVAAVGVVTVVGHTIWVVLALIFGAGRPRPQFAAPPDRCRNCKEPLREHARRCPECGLTLDEAAEAADLRITKRQLTAFHDTGLIDTENFRRLAGLISDRQRALSGSPVTPPAAPSTSDRRDVQERTAPIAPSEFPAPTSRQAAPTSDHRAAPTTLPKFPADVSSPVFVSERGSELVVPPNMPTPVTVSEIAGKAEDDRRTPEPLTQSAALPDASFPLPVWQIDHPPPSALDPPPAPRVSWGEWLGTFLEQRNIFWGELVGGLLVVGCSIALILSLWQTLERIPLFPFLASAGITSTLFGVGHYSLSRWKLESSSRGLLVIAILLVPLNFLVLAGISPRSNDPIELAAKVVAALIFALLVRRAGKVLLPAPEGARSAFGGWLLPLATIGPALAPLLAARAYGQPEHPLFALVVGLPVVCQVAGIMGALLLYRRSGTSGTAAAPLLGWIGFASYSFAVSVAFLAFWVVSQNGQITEVLRPLACPAVAAGASILMAGLFVQRRAAADSSETRAGLLITGATGIALLGGLVQLTAYGLAWPERMHLLAVGFMNYVLLTLVALRFRFTPTHALALPSLLVGFLAQVSLAIDPVATAWPFGNDAGLTGVALACLAILIAAAADYFRHCGRGADERAYQIAAGVIAALSIGLVAADAESSPRSATLVGAAYAVLCLVLSRRWRLPWLDQVGALLLPFTVVAALQWAAPGAWPQWGTTLALTAVLLSASRGTWLKAAALAALLSGVAVIRGLDDAHSAWHTGTAFSLAAAMLIQAGRRRQSELTWAASALLLAGIAHWLILSSRIEPAMPWMIALLVHASICLAAGLIGLRQFGASRVHPLSDVFVLPIHWSGQITSIVAAMLLTTHVDRHALGVQALGALWLGGIWLAQALIERRAPWFIAFQIAVTASVALGTGYWLEEQARMAGTAVSFTSVSDLYTFGVGLGGIAAIWAGLRRALERHRLFGRFYEGEGAFDHVLLASLVVGQLVLAAWLILPEVVREVVPAAVMPVPAALSEGEFLALAARPWLVLGLLTMALALLVGRFKEPAILPTGFGCLALSAGLLSAGWAAPHVASASAMRWCLALASIVAAAPRWLGRRNDGGIKTVAASVSLSLALALPVIVLSAATTAVILGGDLPAGPAADSFFARIGWQAAHGLPLAAIVIVLVGHACREARSVYALLAGILVTLSIGFGRLVAGVLAGDRLDDLTGAAALQEATAAAAIAAICWLIAVAFRRWQTGVPIASETFPLWPVQQSLAFAGNFLLLGWTGFLIAAQLPNPFNLGVAPYYPKPSDWFAVAAGAWGWIALALTLGASLLRRAFSRQAPSADGLAIGFLGVVILLAGSLSTSSPMWGYRTLLLGSALLAIAAAWSARRSVTFDRWVAIASILTFALAMKATLLHADSLVAIIALAATSIAGLWLAMQRKRPLWATLAAFEVQCTVAMAIWRQFSQQPFDVFVDYLVQSITMTAALLLLLDRWLRAPNRPISGVFTLAQMATALTGLALLFGLPCLSLIIEPTDVLKPLDLRTGEVSALGSLLVTAAAFWLFARWSAPAAGKHVFGGSALLVSIWAAFAFTKNSAGWDQYHVLMISWAAAAVSVFLAHGKKSSVWAQTFALLVACLALRAAWDDPRIPYWTAGGALWAAGIFIAIAWRDSRRIAVWISGGLVNLAGLCVWVAWRAHTEADLAAIQSACLAATAILWFILDARQSTWFREAAIGIGVASIAALVCVGIAALTSAPPRTIPSATIWIASGLLLAASLTGFRTPALRFADVNAYLLGLCAVAFALLQLRLPLGTILAPAIVWLAEFLLVAQLVERRWSRPTGTGADSRAAGWFTTAQLGIAAVIVPLSLLVSFSTRPVWERLAGALSLAVLCAVIVMLALRTRGKLAAVLEQAAFGLGVLVVAASGWATCDPNASAPLLHASVFLLAALGLAAAMVTLVAPRLAGPADRWVRAARRAGPIAGVFGIVVLVAVLLQELMLFQSGGAALLNNFEIALVAVTMLGLTGAALALAIHPGLDPLGISGPARRIYVYGAESLLALLFLHLRLNIPGLEPARLGLSWAVPVMFIAFAGVGLAEFFRRRGLDVLADPIHRTGVFLPALPLIAFWISPVGASASFRSYSLLWLSAGVLYGALAIHRRSYRYVLGSALAMNAALWAMYGHEGIGFLVHPQLWLLPLALIVLASEYWHRDRLAPELAAGLRYGGLAMIYLSSTSDMFLAGLGESAPLLLVLAILSVAGALAGILLRVRAYLFLGSGFLVLVIFQMIWHAAVERQQTWVWWACGILLGVIVLAVFAILERRGQRVREALERFREWR